MIRAWHFVGKTLRDGSKIPKDGAWLNYVGPIKMCQSGLHASRQPFDAMRYAPGETLCLVDCDGEIIESDDKLVCSQRRIVTRMDATKILTYFARMQALSVVHLWNAPDIVLDYLMTGDESARDAANFAARDAANAAAMDAAKAAAWAAARDAAMAAAWDAAMAAARDAARDAAWYAAMYAAMAAARDAARYEFNSLVFECFEGAL